MKTIECVELSREGLNEYWEGSALNMREIDEDEKENIVQKLINVKGLSLKR
jgi:hypothetical protein